MGIGSMTLNEMAKEIHAVAAAHGWHEKERTFGEIIALCHSELSEALEEYRNDKCMIYRQCPTSCQHIETCIIDINNGVGSCPVKPAGIAIELADCIIRILEYCADVGVDIERAIALKHEYNKTRPHRHGGKLI